jgi:hypothetical protein
MDPVILPGFPVALVVGSSYPVRFPARWPLPPYPLPGNFQAVCFFPRLIFGFPLGNDDFPKKRDGEAREVAYQAAVGGRAKIWGRS